MVGHMLLEGDGLFAMEAAEVAIAGMTLEAIQRLGDGVDRIDVELFCFFQIGKILVLDALIDGVGLHQV